MDPHHFGNLDPHDPNQGEK
jgi:hypothetical protein